MSKKEKFENILCSVCFWICASILSIYIIGIFATAFIVITQF